MLFSGIKNLQNDPKAICEEMHFGSKNGGTHQCWDHQTQRFKRGHVFTANAHWVHAFVVFLVNEAVDAGVVQNSVCPIEDEIIIDNAEKDLPNDLNSFREAFDIKAVLHK